MIRDAIESDLEAIVAIYNASIPGLMATADTEPVSVESRRRWLQDRDYVHYPVWVSERRDGIVGWLSFSRFYGRAAYAATAEISIYVNPALRRAGIATELMDHAFSQGPRLGSKRTHSLRRCPTLRVLRKHPSSLHRPRPGEAVAAVRPVAVEPRTVPHPRNYTWAESMKRVWALDVLECPRRQGHMRVLAAIHPPDATQKILDCLGLPSRAPPVNPAVQPTETDWL